MGSGASTTKLTSEEVEDVQYGTHFSGSDIKRLYERFQSLDRAHSGYLTSAEFRLIPELSMNPICERIIALFDDDDSDRVNFNQFVRLLAALHPQAPLQAKRKLAFRCYDVDGDGVVSHSDLFRIMKLMVGSYIDDDQLNGIVAAMLAKYASTSNAKGVDADAFSKIVSDDDVLALCSIEF